MRRLLLIFILIFSVFSDVCAAGPLRSFSSEINSGNTVYMHFKQRVYTPEGALQGEYEGHMWYKAPDSFRVEYVYPETEVIITNGRGYSDYIPGDDELVQGGLEDIIFVSPFMMLDNMDGLFLVQEEKGQYRLSTKSEETGDISEIRVEFKDKRYPSRLTVDFHSGNIVVYQLLEYRETGAGEGLFSLGSYQRLYHLDMK